MVRPSKTELEREVRIAARPERIFPFFTDLAKMIQWKGINAYLDPRPGGIYRVNINGRNIARGEYVEIAPFHRVLFTWGWEGDPEFPPGVSTVEVTLTPDGDGTIVRLRHLGRPAPAVGEFVGGWEHFLPRLATVGEGRDAEPDPWAAGRPASWYVVTQNDAARRAARSGAAPTNARSS